ncbi:MAG: 2Fe-2S iron-sulfur cluster-binding protein [Bdellovibrionales bacterium]|nr:2Fe-2S iron-sulfur cluster-binding protein [Bdellovibrionales bacterium]
MIASKYLRAGRSVLDIAVENSVDIPTSCGAMGTCTTCRVFLQAVAGSCPNRNELEEERAEERGFAANERLSCQLEIPEAPFAWIVSVTDAFTASL